MSVLDKREGKKQFKYNTIHVKKESPGKGSLIIPKFPPSGPNEILSYSRES